MFALRSYEVLNIRTKSEMKKNSIYFHKIKASYNLRFFNESSPMSPHPTSQEGRFHVIAVGIPCFSRNSRSWQVNMRMSVQGSKTQRSFLDDHSRPYLVSVVHNINFLFNHNQNYCLYICYGLWAVQLTKPFLRRGVCPADDC